MHLPQGETEVGLITETLRPVVAVVQARVLIQGVAVKYASSYMSSPSFSFHIHSCVPLTPYRHLERYHD